MSRFDRIKGMARFFVWPILASAMLAACQAAGSSSATGVVDESSAQILCPELKVMLSATSEALPGAAQCEERQLQDGETAITHQAIDYLDLDQGVRSRINLYFATETSDDTDSALDHFQAAITQVDILNFSQSASGGFVSPVFGRTGRYKAYDYRFFVGRNAHSTGRFNCAAFETRSTERSRPYGIHGVVCLEESKDLPAENVQQILDSVRIAL